jgi:hypothetical protein
MRRELLARQCRQRGCGRDWRRRARPNSAAADPALTAAASGGGLDVGSIIGQLIGAIVTVVVGMVKNAMSSNSGVGK